MTLPSFGRYRPAPEKPGKPLHERFLAEGRFLKKNLALGKYIECYEKEIEQRNRIKGIVPAAASMQLSSGTNAADAVLPLREISFPQFIKEQKILTEQLKKPGKENL